MIFYDKGPVMIRTAIESDIGRIAEDLRETDAQEVMASHGHTPLEALTWSYTVSQFCLCVVFKGKPVAMFGLVPDNEQAGRATIWFLAANGLYGMSRTFIRLSREFINWMLELYPLLYNYVDARNEVTIRWLKWCGANFAVPEPYGAQRVPFRLFTIERYNRHV